MRHGDLTVKIALGLPPSIRLWAEYLTSLYALTLLDVQSTIHLATRKHFWLQFELHPPIPAKISTFGQTWGKI